MKQKKNVSPPSVVTGQVWKLADSNVEITLVGRTLVHYRHAKQCIKRAPTLLLGKVALEEFLRKNKAVLANGTELRHQPAPRLSA